MAGGGEAKGFEGDGDGEGAHLGGVDVIVVAGDFNEDFGARPTLGRGFRTVARDASRGEPLVSRPAHKQGTEQRSGKGLVDYIFVKAATAAASVRARRPPPPAAAAAAPAAAAGHAHASVRTPPAPSTRAATTCAPEARRRHARRRRAAARR